MADILDHFALRGMSHRTYLLAAWSEHLGSVPERRDKHCHMIKI